MSDTEVMIPPGGGDPREVLKDSVPRMQAAGWTVEVREPKKEKPKDNRKKDD